MKLRSRIEKLEKQNPPFRPLTYRWPEGQPFDYHAYFEKYGPGPEPLVIHCSNPRDTQI